MKNTSESGRSMLEMLSILVIVAILSLIAIFGYKYALTRNQANTLIDGLSRARVHVASMMDSGNTSLDIGDAMTPPRPASYQVMRQYDLCSDPNGSEAVVCTDIDFDIIIDDISPEVCEQIISSTDESFARIDVQIPGRGVHGQYCLNYDVHVLNHNCKKDVEDNPVPVRMVFSFQRAVDP